MRAEGYLSYTEVDDMDEEDLVHEYMEFARYQERKAAALKRQQEKK